MKNGGENVATVHFQLRAATHPPSSSMSGRYLYALRKFCLIWTHQEFSCLRTWHISVYLMCVYRPGVQVSTSPRGAMCVCALDRKNKEPAASDGAGLRSRLCPIPLCSFNSLYPSSLSQNSSKSAQLLWIHILEAPLTSNFLVISLSGLYVYINDD